MGLLQLWYGKPPLTRELHEELNKINKLIEESEKETNIINSPKLRIRELQEIFLKKKGIITKEFRIEKLIKKQLRDVFSGKTKSAHPEKIIALSQIERDCNSDQLLLELKELFEKELLSLQEKNPSPNKISKILRREQEISHHLNIIIQAELNETHIHFGPSVDAHLHWKYLKKFWKDTLNNRVDDEHNIITHYEKAVSNGGITGADIRSLKNIMSKYFKGDINESKALYEFNELLYMKEKKESFHNFINKAEILNVIQYAVTEEHKEKFFLEQLRGMVKHNLAHNITHIEIRFPLRRLEQYKFFAKLAKRVEFEFNNKIQIRYIEFLLRSSVEDAKKSISCYNSLPKSIAKYIIAFDDVFGSLYSSGLKSPIPVITHAGEHFSTNIDDRRYNLTDKREKNILLALDQIERCLKTYNIARIGHATVLGTKLKKELKGHKKETVDDLIEKQEALLLRIKRRNIIIETNPTSNLMIRGMKTYKDHPISEFSKQAIKFSISTDDRVSFDTNLRKEFFRITQAMKWNEEDLRHAIKMTRDAKIE